MKQDKLKQLDGRFNNTLKNNWGLETLVSVGESWLPAMLEQVCTQCARKRNKDRIQGFST